MDPDLSIDLEVWQNHGNVPSVPMFRPHVSGAYTAAGAISGATVLGTAGTAGGAAFGAIGFAGGPLGFVTVPVASAGGGIIGGVVGGAGGGYAGFATGQASCSSGTGNGGSSGGSGGRKGSLGSNKSAAKWANQMRERGWTEAQIDEAIEHGAQYPAENKVNPGNGATRYVHPATGRSIVLDNTTGEVIHVGGDGFKY